MGATTTIRVTRETREALGELAQRRGEAVSRTIDRAVRLLEQETMGADLSVPLRGDELAWLDADAG